MCFHQNLGGTCAPSGGFLEIMHDSILARRKFDRPEKMTIIHCYPNARSKKVTGVHYIRRYSK